MSNTTTWNPNLTLPEFKQMLIFLLLAAYINQRVNLQAYTSRALEFALCIVAPILYIFLVVCISYLTFNVYYLVRWVLIFNGAIPWSLPWYLVNIPTFLLLDIHTIPWVVETFTFFIRCSNEYAIEHKHHIEHLWREKI